MGALLVTAAERPQPPRRWVLTETRTLAGVGRAQGAAMHDGKLYVYGDADTGVIVEFTFNLQPTGRRLLLTRDGRDLISHPTGLTFHPRYGAFIGDSARGLFGRGATIYQIDWERAWADGTLDHAVHAAIQDDLAKAGTRPEFVHLGDRWLLATADYAPEGQVRLYDPEKLRDGRRTSEPGVLVGAFKLEGRTQSLVWEDATGWLYCVQNPRAGHGWRIVVLDLERATKAGHADAALNEEKNLPRDSELEGMAFLPEGRALFISSAWSDNAQIARLEAAPYAPDAPIELSQVLQRPDEYNGKVLTLAGWFVSRFEDIHLQPGGAALEPDIEAVVWVYDIDYVEATEKLLRTKERVSVTEPMTPEEREKYWTLLRSKDKTPLRVIVRGEFQTSAEPRFGHLSAFKHSFILYKVISIEDANR